jgi:small subunit ribosomal protein S16
MSVRVRLTRVGSKKNPIWRVVVADQRSPRDGRFIETIGRYNPQTNPSTIAIDEARLEHWIARGAQPTGAVKQLMKAQAKSGGPHIAQAEAEPGAAAEPEPDADAEAEPGAAGEHEPGAADEPEWAAAEEPESAPAEGPESAAAEERESAAAPEAPATAPTDESDGGPSSTAADS